MLDGYGRGLMEFVPRPYIPGETIAAIATPPGEGGISIIRIAGHKALTVAATLCSPKILCYPSHTAHLMVVYDSFGRRLDEALVLVMRAPKSYTGEDTVELQCHGGMIVSRKVLEACLAAGARIAMPGEFTFKAFMNGRLDLAQAEAIQKLIVSKNEQAFTAAGQHLEGTLSKIIRSFQEELIRLAAILEAWVDFPEEGIEYLSERELIEQLQMLQTKISRLIDTFHEGKKIDQGIALCIIGPPNAGKSSLMNALLDQDRAIVTPIPGTTRDLLREEITIGGLHFTLTDTAGIRVTDEEIEQEGIRRSKEAVRHADLILLVLDATENIGHALQDLFCWLPSDKTIVVWNKIDLPSLSICQTPFTLALKISAKEKIGLEELKKSISTRIWDRGAPERDEVVITTVRHKEALLQASNALNGVILGLQQKVSPEFLAADMRVALKALGYVLGANVTEDILSSIFTQFCIGK
jgi:tRNA modification GTPase